MKQRTEIYGYKVPFSKDSKKRAIFDDEETRFNFLLNFAVFQKDFDNLGARDFNPEQKELVLSPETYSDLRLKEMLSINYISVSIYRTTGAGVEAYARYFYFVDNASVLPVYEDDSPPTGNTGATRYEITLDAWGTYASLKNSIAMKRGVVVEQSTPLHGVNGAFDGFINEGFAASAARPLSSAVQSWGGRDVTLHKAGADEFSAHALGAALNVKNSFYFVGIYSTSQGATLCLCRPIYLYELTETGYASFGDLINADKMRPCTVQRDGYVETINGNISGDAVSVNLLRAYIIPKKAMQADSVASGRGFGYRITHNSVLGDYPLNTAFAVIDERKTKNFYVQLSFNPSQVLGTEETWETRGAPVYVDIGTANNRLQVAAPVGVSRYSRVGFTGQVTTNGYSLIMDVDGRQIDIGGDFEIPVPDSPAAEAFARNKWSVALQGVSHVGGLVAAVASKNPVALVGATISAGQYVANIGEAQSVPAVIQGQGNGFFTCTMAELSDTQNLATTRGAVYVRYVWQTPAEVAAVREYGYKWRGAFVDYAGAFNADVFGGKNAGTSPRFIKTAGACVLSNGAALPASAARELAELFDGGVWITYNPTTAGAFE